MLFTSPAIIYSCNVIDPEGRLEDGYPPSFVSDNITKLFGYEVEECLGNPKWWPEHIHPEDVPRVFSRFPRFFEEGHLVHEYRFQNKDGPYRWVRDELILVRDDKGRPSEFVGSWMDITERKQADEALRESEERYRHIYNNTPVMLHSIDRTGRLISVSDYWLDTFGYERNEVIGRKSVEFLSEKSHRFAEEEVLPEFMRTGICKNVPYQFVKKNGEVIDVLLSAIAEKDDDGNVICSLAVLNDVTARKRAEETLREREKRLEQQAKHLEEMNTALKVLLEHRDEEKGKMEENILLNVKKLILPYIEKMEKGRLDVENETYLNIVKSNLDNLISPFVNKLSSKSLNLTPTQIQIVDFIKYGKTSKEIASLLNVTVDAISVHRYRIRKRLGLLNKKVNLRSYLQSLAE
ncbi:MAG: PAS domain S-box protein [Bacteroidia bacterium]|nr:PAS domain S-box protein [Bacteroidia bacterium]